MDTNPKPKGKPSEKNKPKTNTKWVVTIFLVSFFAAAILTFVCEQITDKLPVLAQFIILLGIIGIGIIFDMVGLAVATAEEKQFHSMAARRIKEGKVAVWLIRNAEKMSSICNDVIGDICGIVSGATAAAIVLRVFTDPTASFWGNLFVTGLVSGVTIGGKAMGKTFGINYSEDIIYILAKILKFFPLNFSKK